MTLEFEKLTHDLEKMALSSVRQQARRDQLVADYRQTLNQFAEEWIAIQTALSTAKRKSDDKLYRSARPFDDIHPLNAAIDPQTPPATATIIATDGSQIMPDRHAAYLYYLINVGGIIYPHGSGEPPQVFSEPEIVYPDDTDEAIINFNSNSGTVSIERDLSEIGTLADKTFANRHLPAPILSIVDQRLLYWPIGNQGNVDNTAVTKWGKSMTKVKDAGALLAGYIDRPGTIGVTTLLRSLSAENRSDFDWKTLGTKAATGGLIDTDIFREILQPGQRSKLFVNISKPNEGFPNQDEANEVCFFYLNPGVSGKQIARVDVPRWVADLPDGVENVHALIISQCRIIGDYPYVLARADEMAVVGRQDASELNFMLDIIMQRHGIASDITAKQGSKELARGGRTRHDGL
ncbi:MAG: DNA double-strand break repair nuclease NurA [bacterium]|nr:DNA double-strand break repair nuclease NurA [bacterium]